AGADQQARGRHREGFRARRRSHLGRRRATPYNARFSALATPKRLARQVRTVFRKYPARFAGAGSVAGGPGGWIARASRAPGMITALVQDATNMVVIRLARGGANKRPFYNIVVADSRLRRDGR